MSTPPLISIGLCTYNGEAFLGEQLNSLVCQTYRPIEIRIRDDRSEDSSLQIIGEFQRRHSFIHLIQNEERMGLQRNFEAVFLECEGELIAPCDQDDIWHPQKLERLQQELGDHQIVYHDSELVTEIGKPLGIRISDKFRMGNWNSQEPFLLFNCISGHSMLFRRSLLKTALPFPLTGYYDHWLAWVALGLGSIGYCPEVLVDYRQHQSNQTDLIGKKNRLSGLERAKSRITRENSWLQACSQFIGNTNPSHAAVRLENLAKTRENSFFNFGLGWEIWKNRSQILPILPHSGFGKLAFAIRYSLGLKTKKLFYAIL